MSSRRVKERLFRFKQFSVKHSDSSMPVGVDGVLVGSWANPSGCREILDVGTGCGLIALILSQRNPNAHLTAIDIDEPSISEARANFQASPWRHSLTALNLSLKDFAVPEHYGKFDLIVSNPPFFDSGISTPDSARLRARHEASLPLDSLACISSKLLASDGSLCVILPNEEIADRFIGYCESAGLHISRCTLVKGHNGAKVKRRLMEFGRVKKDAPQPSTLILETSPGVPTDAYKDLCSDLYLKF